MKILKKTLLIYLIYFKIPILIIAVWIIGAVGLMLFPLIPSSFSSTTSNHINSVLINLSYSYIAAYIFYLFTSVIPNFNNRKTVGPAIKSKVNNLNHYFRTILMEFSRETSFDYAKGLYEKKNVNKYLNQKIGIL